MSRSRLFSFLAKILGEGPYTTGIFEFYPTMRGRIPLISLRFSAFFRRCRIFLRNRTNISLFFFSPADPSVPLRVLLPALLHRPDDHHDLPLRPDGPQDKEDGILREEHGRARGEQAGPVQEGHTQDAR